ncbi:YcjF family protein [Corallincola platygyrae]|uniref:YcjF family protein n=1 Tax=Corallincola platygyrae TaxID=1193278 RepID=A0ABW4XR52_9GAMM
MSKAKKSDYQQQQLFEVEADAEPSKLEQAIILEETDNWQSIESELEIDDSETSSPTLSKKSHPMLWTALFLTSVIALIEAVEFFNAQWHQAPALAVLYGSLFALVGGWAAISIFTAWRRSAQLTRIGKRREVAERILDGESSDDVVQFCVRLLPSKTDEELSQAISEWKESIEDHHSDKEVITLFEQQVMQKLDDKAKRVIASWSSEAAVLIALSPLAAIDMLLIAWRNMRMVDEVAAVYGIELGVFSRWLLIKTVMLNVIYAGVSETLSDVGLQAIGADMTGKLSGRVAQGMGAGLLTARLGIKSVQVCRALPYVEAKPLKVRNVAGEIFATLKKRAIG